MKSSSSDSSFVTFVSEGMTHSINFVSEPNRKLAAINVSQCHLLEISNRDADKKRTVMSLTHFMVPHLSHERSLNRSVQVVLENFTANGGDLSCAEFRIYGGVAGENFALRNELKDSILKNVPEAEFSEPKGHEARRDPEGRGGESIDYLFARDGITFRKMTLESLSRDDESLDEVSKNLQDQRGKFDKTKVDAHQSFLDHEFRKVRTSINLQTRSIESDLARGDDILKKVYSKIDDAMGDAGKLAALARIIESQVEPMSIKVCGRNGLIAEGIEVVGSSKVSKSQQSPTHLK